MKLLTKELSLYVQRQIEVHGRSVRQIALELVVTQYCVRQSLNRFHLSRVNPITQNRQSFAIEHADEVLSLYEEGKSDLYIAAQFNVSKHVVRQFRVKRSLPTKQRNQSHKRRCGVVV